MQRFKKFLALAMSAMVLSGVLAGCSSKATNSGSTTQPATSSTEDPFKENIEISVAFWDIENFASKFAEDKVFQEITKKLNITIKPVNVTWDDYAQKLQMWAASGQLPDIFATDAIGTQYYRNWTSQGIVKALPSDMSKYPNLQKYFEAPDIKGLKENGKYYAIPRRMFPSVDWSVLDRPVIYRWDLAQKAGITKEPETWDEFQAMLKAIVEKDPEGKKVTGLTSSTTKMIGGLFWLYSNPAATSDGSGSDFKWIKEDGKYVPAVFSKEALPSLENMRKMYNDGIIDPDIALTKPTVAYDKFASGKSAAILAGGGFINLDNEIDAKRWQKANPGVDINTAVKVLKPLKNSNGERYHAVFKTYWSESYISAKVDDKKLDRIMRLYDYIISPEGKDLLTYGIKDVDYKVEGDKKIPLTENLNTKYPAKGLLKDLVAYETSDSYKIDNPKIANVNTRQVAVDYIDWVIKNTKVPDYKIELTYLSTPTKDKFTVMDHDDLLKIMLGKDPVDKMWNDLLNGYKGKGLDKMIEEVNAKAKEMGIN